LVSSSPESLAAFSAASRRLNPCSVTLRAATAFWESSGQRRSAAWSPSSPALIGSISRLNWS
jgi:hypothetical protein